MYCNVILKGLDFCQIFQKLLFTMNLNVSKDPRNMDFIWNVHFPRAWIYRKILVDIFWIQRTFFSHAFEICLLSTHVKLLKMIIINREKRFLIQCTIFRMLLNCVVYPPRIKLPQNKPQIISTPEQTDTGRQLSLQPSAFVTRQIQILVQIQKQIWKCMKIPSVPNKKYKISPGRWVSLQTCL